MCEHELVANEEKFVPSLFEPYHFLRDNISGCHEILRNNDNQFLFIQSDGDETGQDNDGDLFASGYSDIQHNNQNDLQVAQNDHDNNGIAKDDDNYEELEVSDYCNK